MLTPNDATRVKEALRLNDRYLREVVLAFDFCPWAERALLADEVHRQVMLAGQPTIEEVLAFVDHLEQDPRRLEVGLLLLPRFRGNANDLHHWTGQVLTEDRRRRHGRGLPPFIAVSFHPEAPRVHATADQLVAVIRQSPDPMIQFVRHASALDARSHLKSSGDAIAEKNFQRVSQLGVDDIVRLLDEIRRDRDVTYAQLDQLEAAAVSGQGRLP